ncbi:MAG: hypothetical protein ACYDBJ_06115 [Aggregatilineales bacterium]
MPQTIISRSGSHGPITDDRLLADRRHATVTTAYGCLPPPALDKSAI